MRSKERTDIDKRFIKAYRMLYADQKLKTKKEFCEAVGLLPQNFSMLEQGRLSCTVENIINIVRKFGVSLQWLFFDEGEFYANH